MDKWMDSFDEFLVLFKEVFEMTFLGMSAGQLVGGTVIILTFLVLRKAFANTVIAYIARLTKKTDTDLDDKMLAALQEPLKFIPVVLGFFFFTQWFELPTDVSDFFLNIVRTLMAVTVFWAVFNILDPLSAILESILAKLTYESETLYAEEFTGLIVKSLKIAIVGVGVIIILSQWGVNVLPLLGGLGIMGMAIGFGAQDSIANIFGGIKILLDGQFKRGDWIKTPDIEGTVAEIGISTTKVREFDKAVTSIPNKQLSETTIKNYSKMTYRRVKLTVGVEYSSTANQLKNIVDRFREYLQNNPEIAQPDTERVAQMVHLVNFAGSSIDISLYYFTKTTKWAEWRRVVHNNMLEFKQIVEDEGAAFAFPSQSLYLESTPTKPKTVDEVERLNRAVEEKTTSRGDDDGDGDGDG